MLEAKLEEAAILKRLLDCGHLLTPKSEVAADSVFV